MHCHLPDTFGEHVHTWLVRQAGTHVTRPASRNTRDASGKQEHTWLVRQAGTHVTKNGSRCRDEDVIVISSRDLTMTKKWDDHDTAASARERVANSQCVERFFSHSSLFPRSHDSDNSVAILISNRLFFLEPDLELTTTISTLNGLQCHIKWIAMSYCMRFLLWWHAWYQHGILTMAMFPPLWRPNNSRWPRGLSQRDS